MIELDFAQSRLEQIENLLIDYDETQGIAKRDDTIRGANLNWMYQNNFLSFPSTTRATTDLVLITKSYYQVFYGATLKDSSVAEDRMNKSFSTRCMWDEISGAISDRVSSMVYSYDQVLSATKELNALWGISDEQKILINHLNLYNEILASEDKQIVLFHGITLSKEISDIVLTIYCDFILKRLRLLNPVIPVSESVNQAEQKSQTKLVWNGNQKDLLELIHSLQEKGWIDEFRKGELQKASNSICRLFDLTKTQTNLESDTSNSFYQILKGEINLDDNSRTYENIFGKDYQRKFSEIKRVDAG